MTDEPGSHALFLEMPEDVWVHVFWQLPLSDVGIVIPQVSHKWKLWSEEDLVWEKIYKLKWGEKDKWVPTEQPTWKLKYKARKEYQKNLDSQPPQVKEFIAQLPEIKKAIQSNNSHDVLQAVVMVRKVLSLEKNPPIDAVVKAGLVPIILQFLKNDNDPRLQFESLWTLTNVSSGDSQQCKEVIDAGAVPEFVRLMDSPNTNVAEQAVWALGNIAGDNPGARDMVLGLGAVTAVQRMLAGPHAATVSVLRNLTWATSNLCRGKVTHFLHLMVLPRC